MLPSGAEDDEEGGWALEVEGAVLVVVMLKSSLVRREREEDEGREGKRATRRRTTEVVLTLASKLTMNRVKQPSCTIVIPQLEPTRRREPYDQERARQNDGGFFSEL